jgi:hypothetical protein
VPLGDHGDSAQAAITIDTRKRWVCWSFTDLHGIGSLAHPRIGKAPSGKRGPIVITLADRLDRGCSSQPARTLAAILKQPRAYYLVLTNDAHPDGAVRAQF